MVSSVNTSMHAVRGFFWFAHIDGLIPATRPCTPGSPRSTRMRHAPKGLYRLELIRYLHVAQTLTVHHGAFAYLLGINALRASEAAAVHIEDYQETCAATVPSLMPSTPAFRCVMPRSSPGTQTHAPPSTTTAPAATHLSPCGLNNTSCRSRTADSRTLPSAVSPSTHDVDSLSSPRSGIQPATRRCYDAAKDATSARDTCPLLVISWPAGVL
jgi:hypothetical protein